MMRSKKCACLDPGDKSYITWYSLYDLVSDTIIVSPVMSSSMKLQFGRGTLVSHNDNSLCGDTFNTHLTSQATLPKVEAPNFQDMAASEYLSNDATSLVSTD